MTPIYREPFGLPLRWQAEQSVLPSAVMAYFNNKASDAQIKLVRKYLEYYIKAPCWLANIANEEDKEKFNKLIERVETLKTTQEILDWVYACLDWGIDPL